MSNEAAIAAPTVRPVLEISAYARATSDTRIPELDALRGLAALGILALHTLPGPFFWAWSCVDLFFVLSGYLITSILLRNSNSTQLLQSFYVRRILRIWPVYYVTLLAAIFLFIVHGRLTTGVWPSLPSGQWLCFVFLQHTEEYLPGAQALDYTPLFLHSWSLAVEEQFYLLWPLAFLLLRPRLAAMAVVLVMSVSLTAWLRHEGTLFYLLVTRCDGLLFGMVIAYLAHGPTPLLNRLPLRFLAYAALVSLAALAPYLGSHGASNLLGDTPYRSLEVTAFCLLYACTVAAALRCSGSRALSWLRTPALRHAGRLSFAIYMYQVPVGLLLLVGTEEFWYSKPVAHILTWVATLALAQASYRYLEQPILKLKNRFPYARSAHTEA